MRYRQKTATTDVNPMEELGAVSEKHRGRHKPIQYWQKTKITGLNPMDAPGSNLDIARMRASMRRALNERVTEQTLLGSTQRTEITGFDPMKTADAGDRIARMKDASRKALEKEMLSLASGNRDDRSREQENYGQSSSHLSREHLSGIAIGGEPGYPNARQDTLSVRETADDGKKARMFNPSTMTVQLNELRTKLGLRTASEIFAASQRESDERNAREHRPKRRNQPLNDESVGDSVAEPACKRARLVQRIDSPEQGQNQDEQIATVMRALEEEFEEKERQSRDGRWCEPVPHERKVATVREFYAAFHDTKTMPLQTCAICYRKCSMAELNEFETSEEVLADLRARYGDAFRCYQCFIPGGSALGCAECVRGLDRGSLPTAAHVHKWLRCEHIYPDELKDLSPIEEKLIALNSCYGFITKYNVAKGHRESATYPKHVKGHITVFPNNVQELVTRVLPHPLLRMMDEIHVSWQGAEKPAPKDLSVLLSVRRRVVEKALLWLKRHNPHYADIDIDIAEMESWGESAHGVPSQVYARLDRNEPSAWEKTRTAQLVPPTERGLDPGHDFDVREVMATLNTAQLEANNEEERGEIGAGHMDEIMESDESREVVHEIDASGMFALDAIPDVEDAEKLQYVYNALGQSSDTATSRPRQDGWSGSAEVRREDLAEPYILVSRGDDFADSNDVWFFAKAFPTLFPFGGGGPRQIEENMLHLHGPSSGGLQLDGGGVAMATKAVTSRNLSLETWARVVLLRHGGRFANHKFFSFLVFNKLVRFRNHRVSLMSVARKDFAGVERDVASLSAERLDKAKEELQSSGATGDHAVNRLLRNLSLYGFRQPMSRELRLGMRRKIKSLIIREGIPAIWFTLNPNDITNPVKLRLAAYRTRAPAQAEEFLTSLDGSYKRMRLSISDPLSSALFFHREISMFFKYYVKVGEPSVFGQINQYFGAVETNERGALHLHGLLWVRGNMALGSLWKDVEDEGNRAYRERVIEYVDSVFTEVLLPPK
jgi:hypothetical protein